MDAISQELVFVHGVEDVLQTLVHSSVALMDFTSKDVMSVVFLKNVFQSIDLLEWQPWAFIFNEAALEIKDDGVFRDLDGVIVLITAISEDLVEIFASEGF